MSTRQFPMTLIRNDTIQHLANAVHCGISGQDPQQQLKLWRMLPPSSLCDRFPQGGNLCSWLRIVKEKGEAAMKVICTDLNVPMFYPAELAFLSEFAVVMTPVAQATNILQAETNVQMGWLLPTVKLLISKLERIKLRLKYCKPLVDALQVGIEERFGPMMQDPELVAAAILLPKFRTNWTGEEETIKLGVDYIKRHIEDFSLQSVEVNKSGSSEEDNFFSGMRTSKAQDGAKQRDAYLSCSVDNIDLLNRL
ncbi:uncharacterized protein ACNS7B_000215 [Menidia menidia]